MKDVIDCSKGPVPSCDSPPYWLHPALDEDDRCVECGNLIPIREVVLDETEDRPIEDRPPLPPTDRRRRLRPREVIALWVSGGGRCFHCQRELAPEEVVFDHLHPLAMGGNDRPINLVLSCSRCNRRKGAAPPNVRGGV